MDGSPNTSSHRVRPILSIAPAGPSLSTEDLEAIKGTLARGSVDLTQLPLDDLLKRFAQNREDRRLIHIDIAQCAIKDCFAAVKNDQVDAREKAFRDSPKGESTGHYFYRFFVVKCEFSKSKATKISTYLDGLVREGLDPAEIRKQMVKNWTLEDGYNEALRARDETEADDYDDDESADAAEPSGKSSKKARRATKGSPSSDDDGPPKPPKSGKKLPADEQEDDEWDEDNEPKATKKGAGPIKIVGEPEPLGLYNGESLARVRYGKRGQPLRITYLSAGSALEDAENQLHELARRRAKRMMREARLHS